MSFSALTVGLNTHLRGLAPPIVETPEQLEQTMNPVAAQMLSFGHLPVLVDWLLIQSLADTALEPVASGTHAPLFYLMDLATQLDPHQFELYWVSANLLSIVRRDGRGAGRLLDRAHELLTTQNFPEAGFQERYWSAGWQLEMMRGYNALFELHDLAQARESFLAASRLPGALPFLGALASRLESREGRIEVALRALSSLLQRKNDEMLQRELEARASEAKLALFLLQLETEFIRSKLSSFDAFLKKQNIAKDPLGGTLSWNGELRRVQTTTATTHLASLYH